MFQTNRATCTCWKIDLLDWCSINLNKILQYAKIGLFIIWNVEKEGLEKKSSKINQMNLFTK